MKMFEGINYKILKEIFKFNFNGIEYDSRKIKKGNIFVAMKGYSLDGNEYIKSAILNGAKYILTDKEDLVVDDVEANVYFVENLRYNLGYIASNLYNHPQDKIKIIGVTGTNGKTTSTYILENILPNSSRIGTTNYRVLDKIYEASNTTPESLDLIKLLDESVSKNVEYFIMEVSSHALSMGRCDMLRFDGAIFTNLSQDHLDYHKTMEEYFNAKKKIISLLKPNAKICINMDDVNVSKLKSENTLGFGVNLGDIKGKILKYTNTDMLCEIKYEDKIYEFNSKLMGKHNLYNIMGVVCCLHNLGLDINYILEKVSKIDYVVGRFELVPNDIEAKIVVDYAHTPDGIKNALKTLKDITDGKVYIVFGAGGNRDKTKRPKMARACLGLADYVIITSDNPRFENPSEIIKDVEKGFFGEDMSYEKIESRKEGIKKGISYLKKGDSLLIAGKGHETYQIINGEKNYFSDREEVLNCLN